MLRNRTLRGQTLIIALVIMGILMVLGLVFVGIVSRNIRQAGDAGLRAVASDLSEAGIRYAQAQFVNSRLGADWRGEPIELAPIGTDTTTDPDMYFLRPGTGFGLRSDTDAVRDIGGPDGLGPYTRVPFDNGRSVVRVRWAPSDPNIFEANKVGQLRAPGAARHYLIIEAIGRPGRINPNDPTTLGSVTPIQFRNYATSNDFRTALGAMSEADKKIVKTRKLIGFATVGLIDQARFIINRDKVSRAADIGIPDPLGVTFGGLPVLVNQIFGRFSLVPDGANPPIVRPNGGGIRSNAPVVIHGTVTSFVNTALGDNIQIADNVSMDNGGINNILDLEYVDPLSGLNSQALIQPDSRSNPFNTYGGHIRDGVEGADPQGWVRNVGTIEGPSITATDPQTGENRYHLLTRTSGSIGPRGNIGRFAHGQGPYVDNSQDRQNGADEDQREGLGSEGSLVHDWFNPNNGQRNSGWKGSFYIPRGAFLQLLSDGFSITRDGAATGNQRTWRRPDGSDTGSSYIRYRLGVGTDGQVHIVNSFTPGVNINQILNPPDFQLGMPFNGVLMFEGNVRVRGVIPTDRQLTVVSMGTIYIEGSITKGVVLGGSLITRPSASMLMLMAKDYVAVNTTMFFGPTNGQSLDPNGDAVRMAVGGNTLELQTEMLLNPDTQGAGNVPSFWVPFNNSYREFVNVIRDIGPPMSSDILITHSMDNGAGQYAMIGLDINYGIGTLVNPSSYLFPLLATSPNPQSNSVFNIPPYLTGYTTPGYTIPNFVPIYGLGRESWQRYSKFETMSFPLVSSTSTYTYPLLENTTGEGLYRNVVEDSNTFTLRHEPIGTEPANDYVLRRMAITPHDVRIEASVFAEQGSFVVIPGHWFNNNPNDRHDVFDANVLRYQNAPFNLSQAEAVRLAQLDRIRDYGSAPKTPFYSEPLDVRVQIMGSVSENMPLPASYQAEWLKKWGWIPRTVGGWYGFSGSSATPVLIPKTHVPAGTDISLGNPNASLYVPNLITIYDPNLATGRVDGYIDSPANPYVRYDSFGRPLAPMPRLPVSPTLAYFGEVLK